jgi:hypothetical protein
VPSNGVQIGRAGKEEEEEREKSGEEELRSWGESGTEKEHQQTVRCESCPTSRLFGGRR